MVDMKTFDPTGVLEKYSTEITEQTLFAKAVASLMDDAEYSEILDAMAGCGLMLTTCTHDENVASLAFITSLL